MLTQQMTAGRLNLKQTPSTLIALKRAASPGVCRQRGQGLSTEAVTILRVVSIGALRMSGKEDSHVGCCGQPGRNWKIFTDS